MTQKQPFISIIILNYNGKHFLQHCLNSIKRNEYPQSRYEIIFVDNASRDGSAAFVQNNYPEVKCILLQKNLGYAGGNNAALPSARGDYLVFLNNDTEVDKHWLSSLVTAIKSHERAGACSSLIINKFTGKINTIGNFWCTWGFAGTIAEQQPPEKYTLTREIFAPTGCSFIIKKELFMKIGQFDDNYFCTNEDVDLGWRIRNAGYSVYFVPQSLVYHHVSPVMGPSKLYYYLQARNRIWTVLKNTPFYLMAIYVSTVTLTNFFLTLSFFLSGKWGYIYSVFKGTVHAFLPQHVVRIFHQRRKRYCAWSSVRKHMLGFGAIFRIGTTKFLKHIVFPLV